MSPFRRGILQTIWPAALVWGLACFSAADEPIVTILADFEDESVAATLAETENVPHTACRIDRPVIPARGQRSLALEIGATKVPAGMVCHFRLRTPRRFDRAEQVAAFGWIKEGAFEIAFLLRDAEGCLFETRPQTIQTRDRWVRIAADLPEDLLERPGGSLPVWPVQVHGVRVRTHILGKQTLYLDDLQVVHRVARQAMIQGEFVFDEPTRIYPPGATVGVALQVENGSRTQFLQVAVELAWTRPDGSVLKTHRDTLTLPASGRDFRSRQSIDFSQRLDQPGLYRLVAKARAPDWITPARFETSLAVTPSNRLVPRGRDTFFGVRSDLMQEPVADQRLEIAIARDLGVHVLAIEVPWTRIEPEPGEFDFAELDPIIDDLVWKNIAPLIVLTGPPADLAGPARSERLRNLLAECVRHFGEKVTRYLLEADVVPPHPGEDLVRELAELQALVGDINEEVRIVSPPLPVTLETAVKLRPEWFQAEDGLEWAFQTEGEPAAAFAALERFRRRAGLTWNGSHWWCHRAAPLIGSGFFAEAESVLRFHVRAALAGVGGVIWYDLRDNDNDPNRPDALRGLVRRDFSPKASLQGYASAAGMLTGLSCRGPVLGTPVGFESALFIGSDRQVAVLLPEPNRILPAVLAPIQGFPGPLTALDFERRNVPILTSIAPPLVPSCPDPLFFVLKLETPQPEPQLALAPPWLRAPGLVLLAGGVGGFELELVPPFAVRRGTVRLRAENGAPIRVDPSRYSFSVEAGESVTVPVKLSLLGDVPPVTSRLILQVGLDGSKVSVPIEVRPLSFVSRMSRSGGALLQPDYKLGQLAAPEKVRASAAGEVYAGFRSRRLSLWVRVSDDRFVPGTARPGGRWYGDELRLGLAVEGQSGHVEVRLGGRGDTGVEPLHAGGSVDVSAWRCNVEPGEGHKLYRVDIPADSLGLRRLRTGQRFLLAVRYQDEDADGLPPVVLGWGGGLDGSRSTQAFRWVQLGRP